MDAHRVDVLDRTDHDAVVSPVTHDLEFEFLPTGLMERSIRISSDRTGVETSWRLRRSELLHGVVGGSRPLTSEDERRAG